MNIGSLFSGYGGLDLGVQQVIPDATVAWHVEFDAAPSRILAHHWPDVPNYGDVSAVDWSTVEPVDIITGGFPCQDLSHAGKRAGLRPGTRSGLWEHMAYAINELRPELVVIENVRGLLSANAHSDVEPCPWCVGDEPGTVLRALGAVAGDLADLGYDAQWTTVCAADAGACHGRARVFIVAQPARDSSSEGREGSAWRRFQCRQLAGLPGIPTDSDRQRHDGRRNAWASEGERARRSVVARPSEDAANSESVGRSTRRAWSEEQSRSGRQSASDLTTPANANVSSSETRLTSADQVGGKSEDGRVQLVGSPAPADVVDFGPYSDAVDRHARAVGRPAPAPTEPGKTGPRLSPLFVEWMMMLPAGHVTDPAIGLSRAQQLKALGNGVVPDQAALALRILLSGDTSTSEWGGAYLPTPTPFQMDNRETPAEWLKRRKDVVARTGTHHGLPLPVAAVSIAEGRPILMANPTASEMAWGVRDE